MRARLCAAAAITVFLVVGCAGGRPVVESYPEESAAEVAIDGVAIRYLDFNPDASGLPFLYIHGYSGSGFESSFFVDDLEPTRRVVAPDLPGSGWSEKPEIEYTLDYMVRFVEDFADTIGLRRFVLIGHSMGGQISVAYAAQHPERVDRLILIAPYGLEGEAGRVLSFLATTGSLVDAGMRLHSRLLLDLVVDYNVFYDPEKIPQDFVDYIAIATFQTDNGLDALASITRNVVAQDGIRGLLGDISMPTLIIWGAEDGVLDFRYAADFNSGISGSRLVAIPNCGHMPQVECHLEAAAAINSFVTTP